MEMMLMGYEEVVKFAAECGYYEDEVQVLEEDDCFVVGFGEEWDYDEWFFHSLDEVSYAYHHVEDGEEEDYQGL